jgi:hypothetical protein
MSSNAENELLEREAKARGLSVTQYLMMKAVPDNLMRDIVNDFRGGMPQSTSMIPDQPSAPVKRGSGWTKERPLRPPDGVELIDQMVEADTARQRQEAVAKTVKLQLETAETLRLLDLEQERRDKELDPFNTGIYDNLDKDKT